MHIAYVSTYPPTKCGIGTYCADLANTLIAAGHTITVIAEHMIGYLLQAEDRPGPTVAYCWSRGLPVRALHAQLSEIKNRKPDVVHVQHEFGIFPDDAGLLKLLGLLQKEAIAFTVTLHTVLPKPRHALFFRSLPSAIVHTPAAYAALRATNPTCEIRQISHGVTLQVVDEQKRNQARDTLKIASDTTLLLCPGFIGQGKGTIEIIEAFAHSVPTQSVLAVVGECRDDQYQQKITSTINDYGLTEHVIVDNVFQTRRARDRWFSAADAVVLGAKEDTPYSSSGQMATALGYGLPVLAKTTPIYQNAAGVLYYRDAHELAIQMQAIKDTRLRRLLATQTTLASYHVWEAVAAEHVAFYQELCNKPTRS